jgi:putative AdoMet-dependent methyltransferase
MRSRYAEHFCHDADASRYDGDVLRESHPIRRGYSSVLSWVASRVRRDSRVLDLGAGTANLDVRLPPFRRLVCVDVSARMLEIGRGKLSGLPCVSFVVDDLLSFCSTTTDVFDHIVSTYAIHHLTDGEKSELLRCLPRLLERGGRAVFGDLMFADEREKARITERHRELRTGIDEDIADEYFWDIERTRTQMDGQEWRIEVQRFSELSYGIEMLPRDASPHGTTAR